MKTGFICASGFNLVATATRHGRRLIAIVLGAPSSPVRSVQAAMMLERGFHGNGLAWLTPSLGTVNALPAISSAPPDLREEMCGPHRRRPAAEELDDEPNTGDKSSPMSFLLTGLSPAGNKPSALLGPVGAIVPVPVFIGPAKTPANALIATHNRRGKPAVPDATAAPAAPQLASAPAAPFPPTGRKPSKDVKPANMMSFAPPAHANEQPPLTAVPAATPAPRYAAVPMPRPRPAPTKKHVAPAAHPKPAAPAAPVAPR
jgi:D-alanyl-D-alanine carboxypeptidase